MTGRRLTAGWAAAALLLLPTSARAAGTEVPDLPAVTDEELAASVHEIDLGVSDMDLGASISPLETETTSGGSATISLNSDILFGFDRSDLSDTARDAVADVVKDAPRGARVTITGYTDDVGSDTYNRKLSTDRARRVEGAVRAARPDLGTTARGRGSADPVEPNEKNGEDNPAGRAKNRRVEITWKG